MMDLLLLQRAPFFFRDDDGESFSIPLVAFGISWFAAELLFYAVFHWLFVPAANRFRAPHPYRPPYGSRKHQLLYKILRRVRGDVTAGENLRGVVTHFLQSWFRPKQPPPTNRETCASKQEKGATPSISSTSSSSNDIVGSWRGSAVVPGAIPLTKRGSTLTASSTSEQQETNSVSSITSSTDDSLTDEDGGSGGEVSSDEKASETAAVEAEARTTATSSTWSIPGICKPEMDAFLAWALWGQSAASLTANDRAELHRCYEVMRNELDLVFLEEDEHQHQQLEPRLLSLDPVNALHRPFALYFFFYLLQTVLTGLVLRIAGFQRVRSRATGLTGWYRPGQSQQQEQQNMPLLFFHGIAPGGLCFYLPMVLWGLLRGDKDRACFLFENKNIAGTLDFSALTETDVVEGVQEILDAHLPDPTVPLTACGHSFGSCQLTWLLSAPEFRRRIRQYVLIDPVTVLLSDPDVMANFLYKTEASKIRLLASSELFTEYYLRRHFAWYNSELWLDDMFSGDNNSKKDYTSNNPRVVVALSEADEIVNAPKVKKHLDLFQERHRNKNHKLSNIYWKGAKHAACVTNPRMWRDIRASLLQNELELVQEQQ